MNYLSYKKLSTQSPRQFGFEGIIETRTLYRFNHYSGDAMTSLYYPPLFTFDLRPSVAPLVWTVDENPIECSTGTRIIFIGSVRDSPCRTARTSTRRSFRPGM